MEKPRGNAAPSDRAHYSDMARKIRELARKFRFAGARQELLDLALRYEPRADNLHARSAAGSNADHH